MWEKFFPDQFYDSVFEIPYKKLAEENIKALIFDVDNTLAPFHVSRPPEKVSILMRRLKKMGFQVCLVSNNRSRRLQLFNENMKLPLVHAAMKPFTSGIKKAMKIMGAEPQSTAVIGDQIFTDIWCGKRAKTKTILVKPVSTRDQWTVRLKRGLEKKVIAAYQGR